MSWSRIDDGFVWHPKVLAAGNSAVGCWVRCLAHCSANKSDGFVAMPLARAIGSPADLRALTDAGLWRAVRAGEIVSVTGRRDSGRRSLPDVDVRIPSEGYWIADYLHYHRARTEIGFGGRDGDDGERTPERRTTRTSERADARAGVQQTRAQTRSKRAANVHGLRAPSPIPSHSEVHPPVRPSASTSVPVPFAVPAEADGRTDGDPPGASEPEPDPDCEPYVDPPADGSPEQLDLVLAVWGWGTRLPDRLGLCRELIAQGLVMEHLDTIGRLARQQGKEPAALGMTWLQSGAWRDVVRDHERGAREAPPKRGEVDVPGPIYGEPQTTRGLKA